MPNKDILSGWEFWPHWFFYIPVYFYVAWLTLKAKNSTFFSLVNPAMKWGGLFSYSKSAILSKLDSEYLPAQILIKSNESPDSVLKKLIDNNLYFPLILKPDEGERGVGVKFIEDETEFLDYLKRIKTDTIIQEYISFPVELGIFFIRDMKSGQGRISSMMKREHLSVNGDGRKSIYELLKSDVRKKRYAEKVKMHYPEKAVSIPADKEIVLVEPIGNHNRGTIFLDFTEKIDESIESVINSILKNLDGFNYGRLDLKTSSLEDLREGRNIKVLEINGANSEPAHIYQPDYSIFKAYAEIFKHWNCIYRISAHNKKMGMKSESFVELYRGFRDYLNRSEPILQ